MNARDWLRSHPIVMDRVGSMLSAGMGPDSILEIVGEVLANHLETADREAVIRVLRRCLKTGQFIGPSINRGPINEDVPTLEDMGRSTTSGTEDKGRSIPVK
jgi:hypothetical protein